MPFKDNLSKITKSVTGGAKTAAKKSGEVYEITKINMSLSSEEDKLKSIYTELGKAAFEEFEKGTLTNENLISFYNQAADCKKTINELKEKINELKKIKYCVNCGAKIDISTAFCPKCGAKNEIINLEEKETETEDNQNTNTENTYEEDKKECPDNNAAPYKTCPNCGMIVTEDAEYCSNCNTKLK